ncbi:hypothetical protein E2C01_007942 [Portunus trituberculatus]|uniref:Uncharacterized protein n=1 Tax=Portunus trituberculatus TaxID=210409 RepID=A0A5B7CZF9_PORTR|nr:hypothetical protein [Portunus trituberculatus]
MRKEAVNRAGRQMVGHRWFPATGIQRCLKTIHLTVPKVAPHPRLHHLLVFIPTINTPRLVYSPHRLMPPVRAVWNSSFYGNR